LVGVQATLNVMSGERYGTVPDELKLYVRGHYGKIPGQVDPNVLDRILADGDRAPLDAAAIDSDEWMPKLRAQNVFVSDEELALRVFYEPNTLDAYRAALKPIDRLSVVKTPLSALIQAALSSGRAQPISLKIPSDVSSLSYADARDALQIVRSASKGSNLDLSMPAFSLSLN
jgi:oxaloacetate decarboxylase alpha subunit